MKHLHGLDLLRFSAAVLVLIYHLGIFAFDQPVFHPAPELLAWPWMHGFSQYGWVGVQIFFVISGFVIAASARGSRPGSFLLRRAIRVFPALWICATIALAIRLAWGEPLDRLLTPYLHAVILFPKGPYIDGVVWTLVVEAVFYGFIAILLWRAGPSSDARRLIQNGAFLLGVASATYLAVALFLQVFPIHLGGTDLTALSERYFFSLLLLRHGVFFAVGMLAWVAYTYGNTARLRLWTAVFVIFCLVQIGLDTKPGGTPLAPMAIWGIAVLAGYASLQSRHQITSPAVSSRLRMIGLMTYPLYLGHYTVGTYLLPVIARVTDNRALALVLLVGAIFALAYAVLRGPEQALQRLAKRLFFSKHRADKSTAKAH